MLCLSSAEFWIGNEGDDGGEGEREGEDDAMCRWLHKSLYVFCESV